MTIGAIGPTTATVMDQESSAEILRAARERESRPLVCALARLSSAHPTSWWIQLVNLVARRDAAERLWIMGHVRIHDAGQVTFYVPEAFHPNLLALAN
jgi:hypothetical protein